MSNFAMDFTIRLGDILTMIGLLGGGLLVITMMRADMRILGTRVGAVETSFGSFSANVDRKLDAITVILVEQAKHDQRLSHVEETLKLMQYGKTVPTQ